MSNQTQNTDPLFQLPVAEKAGDRKFIGNLIGGAFALTLADVAKTHHGLSVIITGDHQQAIKLAAELETCYPHEVHLFPDWETLPYDNFSPHQEIISDRIAKLYQLPQMQDGVLILPITTLLQRQSPKSFLLQNTVMLQAGDTSSLDTLKRQLDDAGYRHVDQVFGPGEYASRGSIIDLFAMGTQSPYRIDFFDDEIDTIRTFDPETQRSIDDVAQIRLMPAHEFPTTEEAIEAFRVRWRQQFEARREPESIYMQVSKGIWPAGIEYWQPLFFEHTQTLFDYFPEQTQIIHCCDLEPHIDHFLTDVAYRYDQKRVDPLRPLLEPKQLWLEKNELFGELKKLPQLILDVEPVTKRAGRVNAGVSALPEIAAKQQLKEPLAELRRYSEQYLAKQPKAKIIFSVESQGRREALIELLAGIKIKPVICDSIQDALKQKQAYTLIHSALEHGFVSDTPEFSLICEADLLGDRVIARRKNDRRQVNSDTVIRHLAELKPGQPVVHIDHGIGRYLGLQTLEAGGITTE
ncbi:MAG: CarD family transcriptional regulator, partial [Vibrio sp.]